MTNWTHSTTRPAVCSADSQSHQQSLDLLELGRSALLGETRKLAPQLDKIARTGKHQLVALGLNPCHVSSAAKLFDFGSGLHDGVLAYPDEDDDAGVIAYPDRDESVVASWLPNSRQATVSSHHGRGIQAVQVK